MIVIEEESKDTTTDDVVRARQKTLEVKSLDQQVQTLRERLADQDKNIKINKDIIGALIDSIQNKDYRQCFELFQIEIKNLLSQNDRYKHENDTVKAQLLLSEQVKVEINQRDLFNTEQYNS
jgi:hypothetical protein